MRSVHFPLASFCLLLLLIQGAQAQPGRVYKSLTEVTDPQQVYILQLRNKRLKSLPQVVLQMVTSGNWIFGATALPSCPTA